MRRLTLFSISFSAATLLLSFFSDTGAAADWCAVFSLLSSLILFFFRVRKKCLYRMFLVFLGIAAGIVSFRLYDRTVVQPCETLDGCTEEIALYVTDFAESGSSYTRIEGRLYGSGMPRTRILLYSNGGGSDLNSLRPGDSITCTAKLRSSGVRYGKPYYGLYATGIYLTGTMQSDYVKTDDDHTIAETAQIKADTGYTGTETGHIIANTGYTGTEARPVNADADPVRTELTDKDPTKSYIGARLIRYLRFLPVYARRTVSGTVEQLFEPSVASFMKSLLLNDRHDFNADTLLSRSMSDAGIMHIVAVSGMHIGFLVGILRLILGNGKGSSLLCLAVVWFFVLMSGAPVSAVRAGILQSMILCAPFFDRENDPPTSLLFALFLILLSNPWAVRSVSLQLSFGAVSGLMLFSNGIYKSLASDRAGKNHGRIAQYILGTVSGSAGVSVITAPLCAYHFGTVQVLSLLTNILVLWAVSMCFVSGYLAVLLALVFPAAGRVAAVPALWLARHIIGTAGEVAEIPFAALYCGNADNGAVVLMIVVYAVFILFHFLKLPARSRVAVPSLLSVLALCLLLIFTKLKYEIPYCVCNVINVGQGQCIAVYAGDTTVMIDCGSTMTSGNAGATAGKYLRSCQRSRVDLLALTHLHKDHANGVEMLLEYVDVSRILIPAELADDEQYLPGILEAAKKHGTAVEYVETDRTENVGDIRMRLYLSSAAGSDDNETCMMELVSVADYDLLVTADVTKMTEKALLKRMELSEPVIPEPGQQASETYGQGMPDIDLLVLGHHGSKYATSDELLDACRGATGVISVGYNTYGHPAKETLENASAALKELYRTDEDGTVQIVYRNGEPLQWLKNRLKGAALKLK